MLMCIVHVENADSVSVVKKLMTIPEIAVACKKLLINFPENHNPTFGYHNSCCKNFTAVPKALSSNSSSSEESGHKQTRLESRSQRGLSSGVLLAKCIFCNCIKHNNLKIVTSLDPSAEIKIQMAA